MCPTYAIDEHTRKNEIEDIEHWSASDPDGVGDVIGERVIHHTNLPDGVGDVRVGGGAAAVVDQVVGACEGLQAELAIDLIVGHVSTVVHIGIHQVKLKLQYFINFHVKVSTAKPS